MTGANHDSGLARYPVVVLSGGSSGIGRGILEAYLESRSDGSVINLSRTCPGLLAGDPRVQHIACDLSDGVARKQALAALVQALADEAPEGEVLLVNNSGIGGFGCFQHLPRERLLQTVDLNISGTVELSATLLPILQERGGAIVTVASTSGFQPTPRMSTYAATKAFLVHWSLALNEELRDSPVFAMVVCPGPTETGFAEQAGFTTPPKLRFGWSSVSDVVRSVERGLRSRSSLRVCGWLDSLAVRGVALIVPNRFKAPVAWWVMRICASLGQH